MRLEDWKTIAYIAVATNSNKSAENFPPKSKKVELRSYPLNSSKYDDQKP